MIELNSQSPIPLYFQLAEHLVAEIHAGVYTVGDKIPSEPVLSADFAVGRPTVRQATDRLVRQGYLERKRGSGTYVIQTSPKRLDLFSMAGTSAALQAAGVSNPFEIVVPLHTVAAEPALPDDLVGDNFWCFSRLSRSASSPLMLETFYLSKQSLPAFDTVDLDCLSLSDFINETYGEKPIRTEQSFSIVEPDNDQSQNLQWHGPIMQVKRTLFFKTLPPVYCQMLCRTDQFEFSQTLGVNDYG